MYKSSKHRRSTELIETVSESVARNPPEHFGRIGTTLYCNYKNDLYLFVEIRLNNRSNGGH